VVTKRGMPFGSGVISCGDKEMYALLQRCYKLW